MNDEQLLIDEMNDFEDFMENADVEEIKKEHGLSSSVSLISPKFKEGVYSYFNITNIRDYSITIYNPHRKSIDLPLYYNDDGYYFFLDSKYISRVSAFDDSSNNIYGVLLKEVNSWIISDFPLYPVNGIEPYLDLYYKHNPVVEVVQGEIVENPQDIHKRICDNFDIVEKSLYEICVDLKTIRDNKYYNQLGYDTFEAYCLECFNISRCQAYKYIAIAENFNIENVSPVKHLGIRKLYCLSRLTDEERTELLESTDIEHTPVKQVEQKAKEIKNNREVQNNIVHESFEDNSKEIISNNDVTLFDSYPFVESYFKDFNDSYSYLGKLFNIISTKGIHCNSGAFYNINQCIVLMEKMIRLFDCVLNEITNYDKNKSKEDTSL